jgi:hypothetical protein
MRWRPLLGSATAVVVFLTSVVVSGCGGDDDPSDGPRVERDEAVSILLQQGYTLEGAECIIENASLQDVDLMSVYARDQVSERELAVLASVQQFCLARFPRVTTPSTGATDPSSSTTG